MKICEEKGATAVEYGVMLSCILLVIFTAVTLFGQATTNMIVSAFTYLARIVTGA